MLQIALDCIAHGWHVFPCRPKSKEPAVKGGFKAATLDETQIRKWWTRWPEANVGIATGASGLCVFDIDAGIEDEDRLCEVIEHGGLEQTYVVRTGRRPGFGVQLYYQGEGLKSIAWQDGELSGDIRCATGYVMAEGSVHPSGATYEALGLFTPANIVAVPDYVRTVPPAIRTGLPGMPNAAVEDDGGDITMARNNHMVHLLGGARARGADDEEIRAHAIALNEKRMVPPLEEGELERIIQNVCRYPVPDLGPEVLIGGRKAGEVEARKKETDPWAKYHTTDEVLNARPVTFLIDEFLTEDAITVIAAPVAQRKSIIALNVVHALVTGEHLFGHFAVKKTPARVLYLCPEMGIQSFSARLKSIGLAPYLGRTLFCTTMASDPFDLKDLSAAELKGSVVVLDTAIRFLKGGDESSAAEMSVFAATVFRLIKDGAASVLMLHHSKKGTSEASELTLDNVMRGSGELGAFVASVWATRLQDGKDEYKTPSYLENVKKRDFDSKPFQVVPVPESYRLVFDGKDGVELSSPTRFKRDKDGKEAQAVAVIAAARKSNPRLSYVELSRVLLEHGIKRSAEWIRRHDKLEHPPTTGVTLTDSHPTTTTP